MSSYMPSSSIQRRTVLYVGGLEESVTEKTLEAAFLPFGDLVQILLPKHTTTKVHRGFGFVEFEEPLDAAEAMANLDEGELFGRVLRIKLAKPNAIAQQSVWATQEEDRKEKEEAELSTPPPSLTTTNPSSSFT